MGLCGGLEALAISRKFLKTVAPLGPDFSGWNWTAEMFSRSITAANCAPWVQVAVAAGAGVWRGVGMGEIEPCVVGEAAQEARFAGALELIPAHVRELY